ncbi:MAG: hypothetical protein RML93_02670 [Anaerolineales bacterium]|nr:hypothetical protein [Anaerolineales bacterium]MCS7249206.1 hypothetical protein [Anaerolineales bacterium]MDW8163019.1 hypothetical protein [Anaerolineales bacterium]MDW8446177.1 hypothetical protein [Anaerolineales bacterium]
MTRKKWFYPFVYFLSLVVAFLPLYTEKPYDPRQTSTVIFEILQQATLAMPSWGWIFHVLTLAILGLALWKPVLGGRAVAIYFGFNYWIVAATQTHASTPNYGFAVHTGALVISVLLGAVWLWVAWKDLLRLDFSRVPTWRWVFFPFALLVFWSPMRLEGNLVRADFNPGLLLTSPEYGFAFCFMTPMLLFLLILAYPMVSEFALRLTAFNGLLYGLFNLSYWAQPETRWLGVMHLPLLVLSMAALFLAHRRPQPNIGSG